MNSYNFREQLKQRTKNVALRIIKVYQSLPKTVDAQIIGKQLLRSGTSVAANYRAACRARSNAEFYSKISICIEETDETMFWLELLWEANIVKKNMLYNLYIEIEEIVKILSIARKNSKKQENNNSVIQ